MLSFGLCWIDVLFDVAVIYAIWSLVACALERRRIRNLRKKTVLITGCDTGFGRYLTDRLASVHGMTVLAACLSEESVNDLDGQHGGNVSAFVMDVTSQESVDAAYESHIKKACPNGLHALVNNAGLIRLSALDYDDLADWEFMFNVNVLGMARVTKRMIHLLRKCGCSRVVNVSSISGRFGTANTSGYNMTKFAVEGMSDSWRREFKATKLPIRVVTIEPGVMKTPLWDKVFDKHAVDRIWDRMNEEQRAYYGREFIARSHEGFIKLVNKIGQDPMMVVDAMTRAVISASPYTRYTVGLDARLLYIPLSYMPTIVSDTLWRLIVPPRSPIGAHK